VLDAVRRAYAQHPRPAAIWRAGVSPQRQTGPDPLALLLDARIGQKHAGASVTPVRALALALDARIGDRHVCA